MMAFFLSCQKAELQQYIAGDGAYFLDIDSANYSFANQVGLVDRDTIYVNMRVLGDVKTYDRPIQLKAVDGTTAIENTHFILPQGIVKANTNTIHYPVVLLNTDDLKTKTVRLELEVIPDANFPVGSEIGNIYPNYSRYKINFNNSLLKPTYWNNIQTYFGEYSDKKYKFMIDVAGTSDFSPQTFNGSDLLNIKGVMNIALQEYEAQNGPLRDENDKPVTFPN